MSDIILLIQSLILGISLGAVYFGGLWLTLMRLPRSGQPALLALSSFLLRSALCLLGFYLILGSGLEGLAACLAGFILMKLVLIQILGRRNEWSDGGMSGWMEDEWSN
jgi:F1F0 ATPase subunit 2